MMVRTGLTTSEVVARSSSAICLRTDRVAGSRLSGRARVWLPLSLVSLRVNSWGQTDVWAEDWVVARERSRA